MNLKGVKNIDLFSSRLQWLKRRLFCKLRASNSHQSS